MILPPVTEWIPWINPCCCVTCSSGAIRLCPWWVPKAPRRESSRCFGKVPEAVWSRLSPGHPLWVHWDTRETFTRWRTGMAVSLLKSFCQYHSKIMETDILYNKSASYLCPLDPSIYEDNPEIKATSLIIRTLHVSGLTCYAWHV